MWFKNVITYRLTNEFTHGDDALQEALAEQLFHPCGSQEISRYGWIAPGGGLQEQLAYTVHGFHLVTAQKEEKILPAGVIRQAVDAKVKEIEQQQHRKVYKKEKDQIKDEVVISLLPRAFSRFQQTHALIAPKQGLIFVDSSSHKKAEDLLNLLRNSLGSLPVVLPDVKQSPSAVMSHWLEQKEQPPADFEVQDECELKDNLVENGTIRIKGQDLTADEITAHLENGKRVTKLALTWQENLSFILHEDLSIKRLKQTEQFREKMDQDAPEEEIQQFDADVTQLGLELTQLAPALIDTFGGIAER